MREGYRDDYIETFGAVYWAIKAVKNLRVVAKTPPFGGRGLKNNML